MQEFEVARLGEDEFRTLRELIGARSGLRLGAESHKVVERKLRERLASLGLRSFAAYCDHLRHNDPAKVELDEALDLVTINETYFFREDYQLRALATEIGPALSREHNRQRIAIWSAGCSTGEEVYSIAIAMIEAGLGARARVFGSDISKRCIATARRGVYGTSSFRVTPPEIRAKHFVQTGEGERVVDSVRALCSFGHLNLLDVSRASLIGRVDVVFCRNVLIYLDDGARKRVVDTFYERLLPGGFLLLGHSESLVNLTTAFELVHLREDLVYRKPTFDPRLHESPPWRDGRGGGE